MEIKIGYYIILNTTESFDIFPNAFKHRDFIIKLYSASPNASGNVWYVYQKHFPRKIYDYPLRHLKFKGLLNDMDILYIGSDNIIDDTYIKLFLRN